MPIRQLQRLSMTHSPTQLVSRLLPSRVLSRPAINHTFALSDFSCSNINYISSIFQPGASTISTLRNIGYNTGEGDTAFDNKVIWGQGDAMCPKCCWHILEFQSHGFADTLGWPADILPFAIIINWPNKGNGTFARSRFDAHPNILPCVGSGIVCWIRIFGCWCQFRGF